MADEPKPSHKRKRSTGQAYVEEETELDKAIAGLINAEVERTLPKGDGDQKKERRAQLQKIRRSTFLYRKGYQDGFSEGKRKAQKSGTNDNSNDNKDDDEEGDTEPPKKKQKKQKAPRDSRRLFNLKQEAPDVFSDSLTKATSNLVKCQDPGFSECLVPKGKSAKGSRPQVQLNKSLFSKYPDFKFSGSCRFNRAQVIATSRLAAEPGATWEASHLCHNNKCCHTPHIVLEPVEDHRKRDVCAANSACSCNNRVPCVFKSSLWHVLNKNLYIFNGIWSSSRFILF